MAREYHGDLHDGNVMVNQRGIFFDVRVVDFYHWGAHRRPHPRRRGRPGAPALRRRRRRQALRRQPPEIKAICRGLRRDLIGREFPTAEHLREYLETFEWSTG